MTYSLDLDEFFYGLQGEAYVILDAGEVTLCQSRGSIDLFCYDKDKLAKRIVKIGHEYLKVGFEMVVKTHDPQKVSIDFCVDNEVAFRFNLIQSFPEYTNVFVKPHYIFSVIEHASPIYQEFDGKRYPIYVPSKVDALILQYIEYMEQHEFMPDGEQHLAQILEAIPANQSRIGFFDKFSLYVQRAPIDFDAAVTNLTFETDTLADWIKRRLQSMPWPLNRFLLALSIRIYRVIKWVS